MSGFRLMRSSNQIFEARVGGGGSGVLLSLPAQRCEAGGSDAELARALRRGHPGAALLLFDRHADGVGRWLQRFLGDDPDLGPLVASVFRRVLRWRDRLGDDAAETLADAVMRATVREARRVLRVRTWKRRAEAPLRWLIGPGPRAVRLDPTPAAYLALDRLSCDRRLAFCLATMGDLSDVQIAAACGWSVKKARRQLAAAIRALSDLLEPGCPDGQTPA